MFNISDNPNQNTDLHKTPPRNDNCEFCGVGRGNRNRLGAVDCLFDCHLSVLCGAAQDQGVGRAGPLGGNEIGAKA